LKGSLDFPRHLARNIVHKERFFTSNSIYDHDHIWHSIFRQTIGLISSLSHNVDLHNRIGALELNFPEVRTRQITEQTFNKLVYTRKTESYRAAIEIARLLLLGFHPDLAAGSSPVLALMFDMNLLWESFIFHSLRKMFLSRNSEFRVRGQVSVPFWRSENHRRTLRPDILIESSADERRFVLDTKWKDVSGCGPSPSDLQQLFAYSQFFRSSRNALVYPGTDTDILDGRYAMATPWSDKISCAMIHLGVETRIRLWQEAIYQAINKWICD